MDESNKVKLARIEEGVKSLHKKVDDFHLQMHDITDKTQKHGTSLAILKRDRWWMFTLTGGAFAAAMAALSKLWH